MGPMNWIDEVQWDTQGLVPAIAQERGTGDLLMLAWMNREALEKTAQLGRAVYFSRSRGRLWHKGEESGHVQTVHTIRLDCDRDVLLLEVTQHGHRPGIACHTGRHSCFFSVLQDGAWRAVDPVLKEPESIYSQRMRSHGSQDAPAPAPQDTLARLAAVIESRKPDQGGDPEKSYVARLLHQGPDAFLKKIGEEATEVVMAAKDVEHGADKSRVVRETADLWFHSMIALAHYGLAPADVLTELERRAGCSGIEEKSLRKALARSAEEAASP
ncbi:bifunctional phosphoribosyl-AMP cyclohydrolase/phosphoribosyl-ATP diphosphatase HisIE [Verminephrobacter aporrectodeae subsp. tuberculatae]|uniref:bifunctional phosphoribosyl-AMP cyclohydrolase/phosphoribosyl-ATP diphosphatase HisIE n=1 Tax=Verminephrobacter aporrectodeae TaxID=1110389 RepID=UPI0022440C07|nr:bifunctional phosphoribosyl-AMP cyclohydrolase/phosphoribosyl-ATP diphosphatase HisIE [Verminephrobacter aporrectodeae]MCW8205996.1 bifunctional phosphoribosyl-AMP cyclohydrolase/phosphoribosyl-ATP diphosphatase HisIE [Verminephrobacter aporrectodeae subsp. tuberculatae]